MTQSSRNHHAIIMQQTLIELTRYKQLANTLTYSAVQALPEQEAVKPRATRFGNIVHTLNHVYVIDDVFRCHLLGKAHTYAARNTETHPPLSALWAKQQEIDAWYMDYALSLSHHTSDEVVEFRFIDGQHGAMSRAEMIVHVVNHGTYHRGFVADMMYQAQSALPENDYTVYLKQRNRLATEHTRADS